MQVPRDERENRTVGEDNARNADRGAGGGERKCGNENGARHPA